MSDNANPLKTYHQRQITDQAQPVRLYGPDGGTPQVQLSGSSFAEEKTQDDLSEGVVAFAAAVAAVLIANRDTENDGVFTVNGQPITIPAGYAWGPNPVGGTPSANVTVAGSTNFIIQRFE